MSNRGGIGKLFEVGGFWSNLKRTIENIVKIVRISSARITKLEEQNDKLRDQMGHQQQRIDELSKKLDIVDARIWNIVSNDVNRSSDLKTRDDNKAMSLSEN